MNEETTPDRLVLQVPRADVSYNVRGQIFANVRKDNYEQANSKSGVEIHLQENGDTHHKGLLVGTDSYIGGDKYYGYLMLQPVDCEDLVISVFPDEVVETFAKSDAMVVSAGTLDHLKDLGIGTTLILKSNDGKVFKEGLFVDGWRNAGKDDATILLRCA